MSATVMLYAVEHDHLGDTTGIDAHASAKKLTVWYLNKLRAEFPEYEVELGDGNGIESFAVYADSSDEKRDAEFNVKHALDYDDALDHSDEWLVELE